jgi:cobalt-zinc-cadmium efflux system outer membrane protein
MRSHLVALAFVLAAQTHPALAQGAAGGSPALTLAQAMRLAETAHPSVRAREAQLSAAEGTRREAAAWLFNNPGLNTEAIRRRADAPVGAWNEWSVGIAQPFETGGQQARRREAAAAGLDALRAEVDDLRRQARADAATRFVAVLSAQRRVQLEQRAAELFDSSAQAVAKRRAAGEDTRLDANVALVEAERARNSLALASEKLIDARSELATAVQLPPSALPEVVGDFAWRSAEPLPYDLEQLLASAQTLPKQRALMAREDAARARLGVEQGNRNPDVTVGLHVGREGSSDARERLAIVSLSVPLPIFKRNDAAIGQAMTDMTQAEIERANVLRDTQARVRQLWSRLGSQRERVQRLQRVMVPATIDNQQLSLRSRQAGQIGLLDQLLVDRQSLDAERDLNDLLAELQATRIELEYAAGWPHEGTTP